jgi:PPM family protein phosphatase
MSITNYQFHTFSYSVTKSGKEKCGDAFAVRKLDEENLIILAVADGVSSCPCDWLASKTACETVTAVFSETSGNIERRMKTATAKTNSAIRKVSGSCNGMMTSLSLAVWEIGTDKIYFLNVGDSRIYVGPETNPQQITVDDTVSDLVKIDGEVLLNAGMPVFRHSVFRSLGQNDPLTFDVQTYKFSNRDLLILVSDGICKNEGFTSGLKDILCAGDFSEKLKYFVRSHSEKNKDDATLVVLWRIDPDENSRAIYDECIKKGLDFREKDLSGQIVLEYLQSDLRENLSQNLNETVNKLLDYAAQFRLKFSRVFLEYFLKAVFKQGTDRNLVNRLRDLIRVTTN